MRRFAFLTAVLLLAFTVSAAADQHNELSVASRISYAAADDHYSAG